MLTALVLITTELGKAIDVKRLLLTMSAVEEAYLVYGVYDILAKVRAENMDELESIVNQLRKSNEIRSSTTMVVVSEKPKLIVLTDSCPKIPS